MLYRALAIFCSILWAGTIIATKFLAAEIPSFAFIFIKYALVVLCLLPFVIQSKEYKNLKTHDIPGIFVLGFLLVIVYNAFFFTALSFAPATSVAIIDAINPIFLMLITTMMGQFTPNRLQFLAFPLSFIGATLIVTHGNMGYAVFTGGIGELFALAAMFLQALFVFVVRKLHMQYSTLFLAFMTALSGLLLVFPFIANQEFVNVLRHLSALQWGLFAFISIMGSSLALFLYAAGLRHRGTRCTSRLVGTTMPLFTLLLAYTILGEMVSVWQVSGGALVLCSLVVGMYQGA